MSQSLRQSQSTLHTWSGLLLGWLLFAVFVTGTIAFYREGLNRWMRPETAPIADPMRVVAGVQRYLQDKAPDAKSWSFYVPDRDAPGSVVNYRPQPKAGENGGGRRRNQTLIGADGQPVAARETRGGEFFYRFHFDLYYMPVIWARWLVGIAAMFMLVAILTGVVTHKKIFRDFFTLRRGKGQRSWLDGHNATAVLGLPFHLMITYTGLVTLMVTLLPWAASAAFDKHSDFYDALYPEAPAVERANKPAPLVDLTALVRDAEQRLGGAAGYVEVTDPNDAASRVTIHLAMRSQLSSRTPKVTYDGTKGELLWRSLPQGGASVTAGAMIGVHAGRFGDHWVRLLYFLCGVAGSVMVGSGLVMWTVKRREKLPDPDKPHFGFRLVERLNVAAVGGLPLGIAAMFWANRLLPVGMAGRAEWEIHCLFLAWGASAILATLAPPRANWVALTSLSGVLLAALPFYNLVATGNGFFAALARGDGLIAGVDAALLVFGIAFLAIARRVARHKPAGRRVRRRDRAIPAAAMAPAE
jgi:uncharacterized iron-regulated membrane protein